MRFDETVVITGGNGFVGRHLVRELKDSWPGAQLVVWDKNIDDLPEGVLGVEVDITKPETYISSLEEHQPVWMAHLAAIAPVPAAMKDPKLTFRVNTESTEFLLREVKSKSHNTKVFVVSSSDIYGIESTVPLQELSLNEAHPRNPYAESKLMMERMIEDSFNEFVLRVRPFPHIGPGQGKGFVTADFASQIVMVERGEEEPVIQVGDLSAKRDFTDVRDVVRAYRLLMEKGKLGEAYHVASEKAVMVSEILEILRGLAKVDIRVVKDEARMRPADIKVVVGSTVKLRSVTDWIPSISLESSLADIMSYWRKVIHRENGISK